MKINVDKRIQKDLYILSQIDKARVNKVIDLFRDKGFKLSELYLKKLSKNIWELRPGRVRILFGIIEGEAILVNVFTKKTAKTPLKELKLAEKRLIDYL